MFTRMMRVPVAIAAFAILSLVAGPSVLADTELGHTGTVGVHSLTDTSGTPAAKCHYKFNSSLGLGKLKSIEIRQPNVRAAAGKNHQVVGWQVTLQRRFVGPTNGPWKAVATSLRITTATSDSANADFEQSISLPVNLAENEGENGEHYFRVVESMFWYANDDQTVTGTARHRADFYRGVMNTGEHWVDHGSCGALSPS